MGRFAASFDLLKSSWAVLKADKELAVIPVLSFLASIATMGVVGAGIWFSLDTRDTVTRSASALTATTTSTSYGTTPVTYVVGFFGYLLVTFVVTFFAAALVSGAYERLTGGNPTLGSALGGAGSRIGAIFLWSLLTGTVGYILRSLEERAGILGRLVIGLIGMAWQVVTWLAVPVIVVENTGPITSLKRSANLFRKTWGENLIAQAGFGLIGLVVVFPAAIIIGLLFAVSPIIAIVIGVLFFGGFSVIMSALSGIFRTALYMYASTGQVPPTFNQNALQASFRQRKGILR